MATDWNTPTNTTNYANVLGDLTGRDLSLAKQNYGSDTNLPTSALRNNQTTKQIEQWNGSSWVVLPFAWNAIEYWCGSGGGSANAQTATATGYFSSYYAGQTLAYIPSVTNTGATTLNVNSIGTKTINYMNHACVGGELVNGVLAILVYDGTNYNLVNHGGGWASWTPTYGGAFSTTYTSVTTTQAYYRRLGNRVDFTLQASGTTGGSAGPAIRFSAPVTSDGTGKAFSAWVTDNGTSKGGYGNMPTNALIDIYRADGANYSNPATVSILCEGFYTV